MELIGISRVMWGQTVRKSSRKAHEDHTGTERQNIKTLLVGSGAAKARIAYYSIMRIGFKSEPALKTQGRTSENDGLKLMGFDLCTNH